MKLDERRLRILTGLITLLFGAAASVFGVKVAAGAWRPVYHLEGTFAGAGQGLIKDSDVKIRGVNVGKVKSVRLVDGQAVVRMQIEKGERIPVDAGATIRPKTLFGEKFVDVEPGPAETTGPYMEDEDSFQPDKSIGGFELERVLSELYPILKAVDPAELSTILSTLAGAAEGTGDEVNRQIVNFQKVAAVNAAHDADTREFLEDFALLSEELARRSGDVVGLARDLNQALPELNARGDQLSTFLEQASRLAADLADVLENNRPFLRKNVTEGGKTIQALFDERANISGFVTGLRQFFQTLSEVGGNPEMALPDGTHLAAIKLIFGGGSPCGRTTVGCPAYAPEGSQASSSAASPSAPAAPGLLPGLPLPALPEVPLAPPPTLADLIGGLLRP
jgi:phospholipid/cholesterol/gamma-HCH transport system substrate-binding protein